jgi:hypothetical protein
MGESDASEIIRQQQCVRHFVVGRVLVDAVYIFFPPGSSCVCSVGWHVGAVSFGISNCVHLTR